MTREEIEMLAMERIVPEYVGADPEMSSDLNGLIREGYIKALEDLEQLPKLEGYVVRDSDGRLWFYRNGKPYRLDSGYWENASDYIGLQKDSLPEITWETEPVECELIIRISKEG